MASNKIFITIVTKRLEFILKEQEWHWSLYQGYYLVCNPEYYTHLMIVTANNQAGMTSSQPQLVISPASAVESKVERFL